MALTLMYITNNIQIAQIAEKAGVDRIWVDMEWIGKEDRQFGMNTVKSKHTVDDIKKIRSVIKKAELLVRVNPIHQPGEGKLGSLREIDLTLKNGADVIMLPMFRTVEEVKTFIEYVGGRAKTLLLLETAEAVEKLDEILKIPGIDEIHIGLNDLHLSYKKKFMFELLCDDTVKNICEKIKAKGIKYGFGGIARVGYGMLPAEYIIAEHYALGSSAAILSRGFCDANKVINPLSVEQIFIEGIQNIRKKEEEVKRFTAKQYEENRKIMAEKVREIVAQKA